MTNNMNNNKENINYNNSNNKRVLPCGFQTPTKRDRPMLVTPPATPSKNYNRANCRKRQRVFKPLLEDHESLFLPELSDCDSPARFPRQQNSSTFQNISNNKRICRIVSSTQLPVLPSNFEEEDCDSPVVIKLAPRFQRERIIDMASDLSSSNNKSSSFIPTTAPKCFPFPLYL